MSHSITYRDVTSYKYQLLEPYEQQTGFRLGSTHSSGGEFVVLDVDGKLRVEKGYAWDGPSGPTIDTKDFMRGSLVHDALYQLMREGLIGQEQREPADKLLRAMCKADGMSSFRAGYVYRSVRWFGGSAAAAQNAPDVVPITAP